MVLDEHLRDPKLHFILRATLMSVSSFMAIDPVVVGTLLGGTREKVRRSPKSVGFIFWEP